MKCLHAEPVIETELRYYNPPISMAVSNEAVFCDSAEISGHPIDKVYMYIPNRDFPVIGEKHSWKYAARIVPDWNMNRFTDYFNQRYKAEFDDIDSYEVDSETMEHGIGTVTVPLCYSAYGSVVFYTGYGCKFPNMYLLSGIADEYRLYSPVECTDGFIFGGYDHLKQTYLWKDVDDELVKKITYTVIELAKKYKEKTERE